MIHNLLKMKKGRINMGKKLVVCLAAIMFAFTFAASGSFAADSGPADMTLKSEFGKASKGKKAKPAVFPHKAHQAKLGCGDCHHSAKDGQQVAYTDGQKIEKCESCHNKSFGNKKLKSFEKAAHKNCKGCHKKQAKKKNKCKTCHPKKKKKIEGC
jgi:hypothetical protein